MRPQQLDLIPPPPKPAKPPPDPDRVALWSRGLHSLASLLGLRESKCRALLGRLSAAAGNDYAALSALLERAVAQRPDDPLPWLIAGARKIGRPDNDWGLADWYAAAPERVRDWPLDVYVDLLDATGIDPTWRGSLAVLTAWVEDGYRPESIIDVLRQAGGRTHNWSPGPVSSLAYFDKLVRRSAAKWG